MRKLPFVSVISAVRNEGNYIEDLIESLLTLDYPKNKFEIIISDGMSTDNTREIISKHQDVKLIENKKKRTAPGRNLAIKEAKGKYIAITDGDCIVNKNWLKILVEKIDSSPNNVVAYGGPNLIFKNDPIIARVVGYMQETLLGSGGSPQSYNIKEEKEVYSIPNCNIIYKKELIEKIGLFEEKAGLGEDADLNFRLKNQGYKFIYSPKAIVYHHRRNNIKSLIKGMFFYGKEMSRITLKHRTFIRWYSCIPSLMILALVLAIPLIIINNIFLWIYGLLGIIYFIMLFFSSIYVTEKVGLTGFLSILLLPIQHISYGIGFIWGLLR